MNPTIQLIAYSKENIFEKNITAVSTFDEPRSFDEFDINIIDLRSKYIWKNTSPNGSTNRIDELENFISLNDIVKKSVDSHQIYILPMNIHFYSDLIIDEFQNVTYLKDMLPQLKFLLNHLVSLGNAELIFEITQTLLENQETVSADFHFDVQINNKNILLKSRGNKVVAFKDGRNIFTTLNIENDSQLKQFLFEIGLIDLPKETVPVWMDSINKFDDEELKGDIKSNEDIIENSKRQIEKLNGRLDENSKFKSILYTNGDELVSVVKEIFEEMLDIDLSNFIDLKREDMRFSLEGKTYICEIKGISSNIKLNNLSQLDDHYTDFLDENPDKNEDNIYQLLIVNHQRDKPLQDREPIHDNIIHKAENKYKVLIIETYQLLDLFEKFKEEKTTKEEIIENFQKVGLFSYD